MKNSFFSLINVSETFSFLGFFLLVFLTTLSIRCIACQIVLVRLTRFFHFEWKNFLKRSSHKERKSLLPKNKKPHGKRESLTRKKKNPPWKEHVSLVKKLFHFKIKCVTIKPEKS